MHIMRTKRHGVERTWFRVVVGDPLLAADAFAPLRALLEDREITGDHQILTRLESTGLHCVAVAYLPGQLREIAIELDGDERPLPDGEESLTPLIWDDDGA